MPTSIKDEQPELFRLSILGIDGALNVLQQRKCYGRIAEELPDIKRELRESEKYSSEEVGSICFRLENIAGIRHEYGWRSFD